MREQTLHERFHSHWPSVHIPKGAAVIMDIEGVHLNRMFLSSLGMSVHPLTL
jgi:hypothetical protein